MTREWKPGDVAVASVLGRENVRVVAGWSRYEPRLRWCELSPRWGDGDDDECWFTPDQVSDPRPLVVIDPEDREQVAVLRDALDPRQNTAVARVQAALRNLIAPPKPEEPTGLGAVVKDTQGRLWVRTADTDCAKPWSYANNYSDDEWRNIAAVKVLSEGVTA